ncbi:phage portal protein [Asticcacaulis taihuensis]|uniref:Phage portal protein, HK97 family n=1 Tax=Asticcacaulis taihuensis TaxID=260084 RepID=A0A1G4RAZ5_9CAUL|nr:phage portal protein [Asticcacaulis taihuensis]SCW53811.1 phage portal protein, HK97 family [Asticcacaulis taihuensis]
MFEKLSGLFRREQKQSAAGSVIAMNMVGKPVWTPRNYQALASEGFAKNAIAYRCVRMIAEACASVPLRVEFEGRRAPDHPLQRLIDRPNPEQGGADLREAVYGGLQTAGNAYVEAAFLDADVPAELWSLRPDRMKVVAGAGGWPDAYEYSTGNGKALIGRDGEGWLKVLHLKLWHPLDDWYGLSPLEAAAFSIDVHNASGAWNKALLDNAARPSGALVYGSKASERLTEDQFARLKDQLADTYSGQDNAGRPLLLEGGLDWKPMSLTPADMDFIQGKNAAAREIALAFGVPAQLLGIPGDNSYANYKEANAAFWRNAVLPLAEKTTRSLSAWLEVRFPGTRIVNDVEALPALSAERDALWARLEAASFLTDAERRHLAGLSEIPGEVAA